MTSSPSMVTWTSGSSTSTTRMPFGVSTRMTLLASLVTPVASARPKLLPSTTSMAAASTKARGRELT